MAVDAMGNYIGDYEDTTTVFETDDERRKRLEAEAKKRGNTVATEEKVIQYEDGSKTVETKREVPAGAVAPSMGDRIQSAGQRFANSVQNAPQNFVDTVNRGIENIKQAPENFVNSVGAVNPADVFKQMQQIESGNRDYDAQGRPIQSPVGAMYKNQVMPATAANPGYGIVPARDNSPEEYNRVGQEYFQAMLKQFGGDTQKAAAAYNAGPGRVQQNMRANQGEMNVAQLPRETQGYLQKLGNLVGSVIPTAQAAPAPQNVRAQAYPQEGVAVAGPNGVQGTQTIMGPVSPEQVQQQAQNEMQGLQQYVNPNAEPAPQAAPQAQGGMDFVNPDEVAMAADKAQNYLQTQTQSINRYTEAQNDPIALIQLREDSTQPDWVRKSAGNRVAEMITSENNRQAAEAALPKMTPNELARVATKKSEGNSVGDWLQYLLFKHVGLSDLANDKAEQLGIGHKTLPATDADGNTGMIKYSANGSPLSGINSDGTEMNKEQLAKFASGGGGKWNTTAETYTDKAGNLYQKQNNEKGQTRIVNSQTGKVYNGEEKLQRERDVAGAAADVRKQEFRRENDATQFGNSIRKLDYDSKLKAVAEFRQAAINRGEADLTDDELSRMGVNRPDIGPAPTRRTTGQAPATAQGAIPPQALPTVGAQPVTTAVTKPGAGVTGRMSPEEMKRQEAQAKLQREAESAVSVDARKDFNGYVDKEIVAKVPNATKISRIRSAQLDGPDGLVNVPEIAGIMASGGSAGREVGNIIRDMITGQFTSVEDLNKRVVGLGLQNSNPKVYNALMMQIRLQQELGPLTIKETAPVGAISDSEQKMNTSNQVDPTRNPAYVTFNLLSKNKFNTDLTQAKADFAAKNPDLNTIAKFNQAWTKEEGKLYKQYDDIYAARAAYVGEYKNTPAAAVAAYKLFPVPAWNAERGEFEYKGQPYAKKRPPIGSFVN